MEEIVKIREAIWNMFPNMWGFDINYYKRDNNGAEGQFTINMMSGHIKVLNIKYNKEKDTLEIKEQEKIK